MTEESAPLHQLEQRLIRAWIERDRETVDEILAADWSVIDPGGCVLTKAQVMAEGFESGARNIESGTIDEVRVRLFGHFAVVTGRTVATGTYQDSPFAVQLRFTDVCEKQGAHWRVVASQGTLIAR
jgi:ketosteroid isomerase-like protein